MAHCNADPSVGSVPATNADDSVGSVPATNADASVGSVGSVASVGSVDSVDSGRSAVTTAMGTAQHGGVTFGSAGGETEVARLRRHRLEFEVWPPVDSEGRSG
jgi:hypothetical protein